MQSFLVVLVTVMVGFGVPFFMLISNDTLSLHDDDPDNPFGSFGETMLTMFNMGMLGDFDRDVFGDDIVAVALFVCFIILVVIMMLNVLIAIVSDSYENAMVRSRQLFLRSRLELAAELELILPDPHSPPPSVSTLVVRLLGRPIQSIYYPLYYATKWISGKEAARRCLPDYMFRIPKSLTAAGEESDEE